jgi:pSer/pThr/pTyr-binding forkhead associated (FHA) protein
MGKLVIKLNGKALDQVELKQGDVKIGRKSGCDVVLDHPTVSGEHASVSTAGNDSFIQDLNSTNGTFIENKRVTRQQLRDGDVVMVGQYALVYVDESSGLTQQFAGRPKAPPAPPATPEDNRTIRIKHGQLFVLEGADAGKRVQLVKTQTDLTPTGKNPGVITRTPDGYRIDATDPGVRLNGKPVSGDGVKLENGDTIEFPGTKIQFYFK